MTKTEPVMGSDINALVNIDGDGFETSVYFSPLNQRIQVLKYAAEDPENMIEVLKDTARKAGFGKVFLKAPLHDLASLEDAGMCNEAVITGYFAGQDAVVMSAFIDDERQQRPHAAEEESILTKIRTRPASSAVPDLPVGYEMNLGKLSDAAEVAELYQAVFASYPFPITDPAYIRSTMESHVFYRIIRDASGALVAAASAEANPELSNAEMTDFATLPSQRGLGLAQHLLAALERDMEERSITNLYTIARARSAGMNRVFYNFSYELTGTLVNNCHISGQFEDMHVWCKRLEAS
jgi:putative beta-lysine N-acetyltransferase